MTFRPCRLLAWLLVATWGASCSSDRSAGGGGFEGETLSGVIRHQDRPLARATVTFVPLESSVVTGLATTDDSGRFAMRVPAATAGFLEAHAGDSVLVRQLLENRPSQPLVLDAPSSHPWKARVLLDGRPAAGAILHVRGSSRDAVCDADGRFTLSRLRSGREWVRLETPDGFSRDIALPSISDSLVLVPSSSQVLLDDFEGSDGRSALGDALGAGWWYALTDTAEGGRSTIVPNEVLSDVRFAFGRTDAWKGSGLSLRFQVDRSRPVFYALIGTVLSDDQHWMDLSKVDSISFMARGSGTVRIVFSTQASLEPTLDLVGYFGTDFELPGNWMQLVVRRQDIRAPENSRPWQQGIGWDSASRRVRNLAFMAKDTATIQIDDIVLHGPSLPDLLPRR